MLKTILFTSLMSIAYWALVIQGRADRGCSDPALQDNSPQVKIVAPKDKATVGWNSQTRYEITVSDPKDGDSKYGEIAANQVLLEVSFLPMTNESELRANIQKTQSAKEHPGLSFIRASNCFGCHGDKTRLAGPSFAEIAKKYQPTAENLKSLATHIIAGSTGVWGNLQMPSHPEVTMDQATQMSKYIIEQGKNENRWIYPGAEGVLRTIEKPKNFAQGAYVLTASYTSSSKLRGQHSIVLNIK